MLLTPPDRDADKELLEVSSSRYSQMTPAWVTKDAQRKGLFLREVLGAY